MKRKTIKMSLEDDNEMDGEGLYDWGLLNKDDDDAEAEIEEKKCEIDFDKTRNTNETGVTNFSETHSQGTVFEDERENTPEASFEDVLREKYHEIQDDSETIYELNPKEEPKESHHFNEEDTIKKEDKKSLSHKDLFDSIKEWVLNENPLNPIIHTERCLNDRGIFDPMKFFELLEKSHTTKKSFSSKDTNHVVKNFIKSLLEKLGDGNFLLKIKSLYETEILLNSQETSEKVENEGSYRVHNENFQNIDFYEYVEATKELLFKLGHFESFETFKKLISCDYEQDENSKCETLKESKDGRLIKREITITKKKKTEKIEAWFYENEAFYEMTRCVMFWYLRRVYYGHVMESSVMKEKSRNLKYIQRFIYELKYPGRCKKLYFMDQAEYNNRKNSKK